jgi:hypothetical protein
MGKLERSIIALLVVTVLAYFLKLGFTESFMTYESATTPNAIARRFEPFDVVNVGNKRCTGGVCPSATTAHRMCLEMAGDNCRIPTYPNNECWMSVYNRCRNTCTRDVQGDCNCTQIANDECGTRGDPAEQCLNSVYQKCMASQTGLVPDPDRGYPSIQ